MDGLLVKGGLLNGPEVYCLKEHAVRQFTYNGGVEPTCFSGGLLRKVLASAKADNAQIPDALMLFQSLPPGFGSRRAYPPWRGGTYRVVGHSVEA